MLSLSRITTTTARIQLSWSFVTSSVEFYPLHFLILLLPHCCSRLVWGKNFKLAKSLIFSVPSPTLLQSFYFVIGNHIFDILHTQLFTSFYHYLHSRCHFFSRLLWCLLFICLLSAAPPGTVSFRTEMKAFCALYSCIGSIIITAIDTKFLSSRIEKLNHTLILIESIVRAVPIVSVLLLFLFRYFIFFCSIFLFNQTYKLYARTREKMRKGEEKSIFPKVLICWRAFRCAH